MMVNCLYCTVDPRDAPLSSDHTVPRVLGGWIKHDCVCKSHNEQLGQDIEGKLKENAFVARAIQLLGLQSPSEAYRHGAPMISPRDGTELRAVIDGSAARLIPQSTAEHGLVVPQEETPAVLRKLISRFEARHDVRVPWQDSDFDSVAFDRLCHIPRTPISFIKRKCALSSAQIEGLDAPISFRIPAKIALTHLAALGCCFVQSTSFNSLKTWILRGGANLFALIGPPLDEIDLNDLTYNPFHYIKYHFVDPHLLALVTLFGVMRFAVYLAEVHELTKWQDLSAFANYHVYDLRKRAVFASDYPDDIKQDHAALLDAVLVWRTANLRRASDSARVPSVEHKPTYI